MKNKLPRRSSHIETTQHTNNSSPSDTGPLKQRFGLQSWQKTDLKKIKI